MDLFLVAIADEGQFNKFVAAVLNERRGTVSVRTEQSEQRGRSQVWQ